MSSSCRSTITRKAELSLHTSNCCDDTCTDINLANHKIDTDGNVTTIAGSPLQIGSADGQNSTARFYWPSGISLDISGNIYVADTQNHTIRKIDLSNNVTTLAGGAGVIGAVDDLGTAARFNSPRDLAVDNSGNVYVADTSNHTIRKIDPGANVTTLAGTAGTKGSVNGQGTAALFNWPHGIAVDATGNVYVSDTYNNLIRKIDSAANVTTIAGKVGYVILNLNSVPGVLKLPRNLSVDANNNIYFTMNDGIVKLLLYQ